MTPTDGFDEETTLGDILSAGPQPTIEKGVTKSPTRKALQQAAQRKEAALRRVLAAQTPPPPGDPSPDPPPSSMETPARPYGRERDQGAHGVDWMESPMG